LCFSWGRTAYRPAGQPKFDEAADFGMKNGQHFMIRDADSTLRANISLRHLQFATGTLAHIALAQNALAYIALA
jgi:hypothetical protein